MKCVFYLRSDLLENSLFPYRLILGMVTLSNTLSSVLAGNAEFSDPVTKVTYDQFSKVPQRLGWCHLGQDRGRGPAAPGLGQELGEGVSEQAESSGDTLQMRTRTNPCKSSAEPAALRHGSFSHQEPSTDRFHLSGESASSKIRAQPLPGEVKC